MARFLAAMAAGIAALPENAMRPFLLLLPALAGLAACNQQSSDNTPRPDQPQAAASASDPLAAHDPLQGQPMDPAQADDQPRPAMQMQVVLDRLGFTPGVIDGEEGLSTRHALAGFQEAEGLPVTSGADAATAKALERWSNIPATRMVTIPEDFARGPFAPLPKRPAEQAKLQRLGYQSLDEALAERFHTTPETLHMLNPDSGQAGTSAAPSGFEAAARFRAGQRIRVPNVGNDRIDEGTVSDQGWRNTLASLGIGSQQPQAVRIVVSKSGGTLKAYDGAGKLVGMYTATMGSTHDPLPLGHWKITNIARNPDFTFNPELLWDVPDSEARQRLPPGPNGPVGVVWLALDKKHYGIHGTPEPSTIGRAQSHGCVRLTNWDAARLAQMVKPGTEVIFES